MSYAKEFLDTLDRARNSVRDTFSRVLVSVLVGFDENAKKQIANLERSEAQLGRLEAIVDKLMLPTCEEDNSIPSAYLDMSNDLRRALGEAAKYKRLLETLLETVENIDVKVMPAFIHPEFKLSFELLQRRTKGIRNLLAEAPKPKEEQREDEGGCDTCGKVHFAGEGCG